MTEERTAFVTGGSGFVGGHVIAALLDLGWSVRALRHQRPLPPSIADRVRAIDGDLSNVSVWAHALHGARAVVHCGALLDPIFDAGAADAINHRATVTLARAAADAEVDDFVFLSSMAAVGFAPAAGLVAPDAPCHPTTHYGRSKLAAERSLLSLNVSMRVVIVRPPTVYGPGEARNFLALTRAIDGTVFPIPGSGDNRMSFCHVDNLAAAVSWVLQTRAARGILHVADERPVTLTEVVDTIAAALGDSAARVVRIPMPAMRAAATLSELAFRALNRPPPLTRGRLTTVAADCALDTRGTTALGFSPDVRFDAGVASTVRWYREARLL